MRFLIITQSYPPSLTARAYRWSALAEHWAGLGHDVDVVCGWLPGSAFHETNGSLNVYRVHDFLQSVKGVYTHVRGGRPSPGSPGPARASGAAPASGPSLMKRVHDATWKKVYWPDYACVWIGPAHRQARALMARHRYDAMISVSLPFTGHLVALRLRNGPQRPRWMLDIGDPFSFLEKTPVNNHRLYRERNYAAERGVFARSDVVSVTNEETRAEYARLFPESAAKVHVIPPLVSLDPPPAGQGSPFPDDGRKRLVFAGALYKNLREPDFLLSLFGRLIEGPSREDLELHFVGGMNGCEPSFEPYAGMLGDRVHLHGPVPRAEAARFLAGADLLVNLGNEASYQLPSKVIEYISLGKPVLSIAPHARDSSKELLDAYGPSLTLVTEGRKEPSAEEAEALRAFLRNPPRITREEVDRLTRPFGIDAISDRYLELLG